MIFTFCVTPFNTFRQHVAWGEGHVSAVLTATGKPLPVLHALPLQRTATQNPHQNISHHAICLRNTDVLGHQGVCPDPANCPVTTDIKPGFCVRPFLPRHLPLERAHNISPVVTVTLLQGQAVLNLHFTGPSAITRYMPPSTSTADANSLALSLWEFSWSRNSLEQIAWKSTKGKNKKKNKTGFLARQKTNLVFLCASFREIQTHLRKRSETFLCVHPSSASHWWQVCWSLTETNSLVSKQASLLWCCK